MTALVQTRRTADKCFSLDNCKFRNQATRRSLGIVLRRASVVFVEAHLRGKGFSATMDSELREREQDARESNYKW
jgi:hypothetical protein